MSGQVLPLRRGGPPPLPAHLNGPYRAADASQVAGEPLVVVASPPGAGKSTLAARLAAACARRGERVVVLTATNAVSAELARRIAALRSGVTLAYVLGADAPLPGAAAALERAGAAAVVRDLRRLPDGPIIAIGNAAKWATHPAPAAGLFDVAFWDEAWQMAWARTWPTARMASRHVMIGDPGQCRPFSEAPTDRWLGSGLSPIAPAAAVALRLNPGALVLRLNRSLRLPQDTADLLGPALYPDLPFDGGAAAGERRLLTPGRAAQGPAGAALSGLGSASVAVWDLPPAPPVPLDAEICAAAAAAAAALAGGAVTAVSDAGAPPVPLVPDRVAVVCARRDQVALVRACLPRSAAGVAVGTANTAQGLEWDAVVAVDPLAGRGALTPFDLSAGRLSVMLSRHRIGVLWVRRSGADDLLASHVPTSPRALGDDEDEEAEGLDAHRKLRAAVGTPW